AGGGVGGGNAPVTPSRVSALNPAGGPAPAGAPAARALSRAAARAGAVLPVRVFAGMHPSCLALRTIQPGRQLREPQDGSGGEVPRAARVAAVPVLRA